MSELLTIKNEDISNAPPAEPTKPKRGRKPKASEEPLTTEPRAESGRRIVKNSELVVMSDCWDLLADMPTAVQRRIVTWLDSQVRENEKADEQQARLSVPQ